MLMGIIVALTIASITLHIVNLIEHHNECITSILSIVFLSLMFVSPFLKRFLGSIGDWIFIIVASCSLLFQGYAYGEHIEDDSNVILGVSVLCTVLSSYVGHSLKKKEEKREKVDIDKSVRYYMNTHVAKFILSTIALIILIVNYAENRYDGVLDTTILVLIVSLLIYISFSGLAFVPPSDQTQLYVEFLCGLGPTIQIFEFSKDTSLLKVAGILSLTGASIITGQTLGNASSIAILLLIVLASVCDHLAAKYYNTGYMLAIERARFQGRV